MRKLILAVTTALVMALAGVAGAEEELKTKEAWPACLASGGMKTFVGFTQAIVRQDEFAVQFYMAQKGCGPMLGGMKAEILSQSEHFVVVRIHPPAPHEPAVVITVREALE